MSLQLEHTLTGHKGIAWHVAWHPEGNLLASCGSDKTIRIWGLKGGRWESLSVLDDSATKTIRSCEWSPCGRFLASVSFDGTCTVWEMLNGELEMFATLEGHDSEVKCVAWSPSGRYLATCSRDKSVWIWDVDFEDEFQCNSILQGHTQDVKCVVWHPKLDVLLSTSYDDSMKIWTEEDDDWVCEATLTGHGSTVWQADFDATGQFIVSVGDDKKVIVWRRGGPGSASATQWKRVATLQGHHEDPIYSVSWSPTSSLIASAGGDDQICIFSESCASTPMDPQFELVFRYPSAHEGDVNCVRWAPKALNVLASTGDDGSVKLWKFVADAFVGVGGSGAGMTEDGKTHGSDEPMERGGGGGGSEVVDEEMQ